ncbi:peptide/nickel transport system ATP-binding protein [Nocardia transvalensis]|uniref:Peptide/nickel transport system ATP-binding protein n=1 Tax=Nocardia transvalensis TaxID=37333 RepID=A0A7W9UML9_9NOCA|nr:ATP-binding cassette domain-containing protein [Nocardia transvalensis]MBB5918497.1 peptide/nickel transport system ATP-binding protein [Nocardia transvalensis]
MNDGATPLISVRGLSVRAGASVLVEDIAFDVEPGRILTLFGPSGAGKTTIAAAVAGIDRPGRTVTGDIRVPAALRIGYLPQHAGSTLNPARRLGAALGELAGLHLGKVTPEGEGRAGGRHGVDGRKRTGDGRIRGGVREPIRVRVGGRGVMPGSRARDRRALVARALADSAFDLDDEALDRLLRRFPHEFSGGERARLALAQVLVCAPDVLVVDEPTVGLDSIARATLLDSLDGLRCAGRAVVLVTHDAFAVRQVSDRILVVRAGRVVDTPEALPVTDEPTPRSSPPDRDTVLRLRAISVRARGARIVTGVDLDLRRGEALGMIGVSGAGKSTIARCISGLIAPAAGEILLDGEPIPLLRKRSRTQIAAIQYVWQESAASFDPRRTVADQVAATGVRLCGMGRAAARTAALDLLADLGIAPDEARRHPAGLSGGQLQRAALARALLARPRILVCDEITTALDRPLAQRILDHVDAYRRETGATILSISHDLRTQLSRADRLVIVDHGRIVETGSPQQLLTHPATTILGRLLAAEALDQGVRSPSRSLPADRAAVGPATPEL